MKKYSITLIFTFGLIGTLLTACFCKDVQPFWKPTSGTASVYSMLNNNLVQVQSGDTIQADSVAFRLSFEAEFIAMQYSPILNFGNTVRATTKCPVDGHEGLKHKVSSISITSNENYNGINAGEDISQFFRYNGQQLEDNYTDLLNNHQYEDVAYGFAKEIYLITPPTNSIERNLTIKFDFENGQSVTLHTLDFTW